MDDEGPVLVEEREGGVLVVTLNRPHVKNAVDAATAVALAEAVDRLEAGDHLRAGVLTGAGGTFCAGMDLKAFLRGESPMLPGRGFGGLAARPARKSMIAAVEGRAVAGGLELVLACDLVVAAREAADWTFAESWERQDELTGPDFTSHDAREGAAAFAEKRAPRWTGR